MKDAALVAFFVSVMYCGGFTLWYHVNAALEKWG